MLQTRTERAVRPTAGTEGSRQLKAGTEGDRRLQADTKGAQWLQTAVYDAAPGGQIWLQDPEDERARQLRNEME